MFPTRILQYLSSYTFLSLIWKNGGCAPHFSVWLRARGQRIRPDLHFSIKISLKISLLALVKNLPFEWLICIHLAPVKTT
jgi:hypothetical protein